MIKSQELSDQNSCMSRARDDEMTFVLLGRDVAAPAAIRAWGDERIRLKKNVDGDPQIKEALACALSIEQDTYHAHIAAIGRRAAEIEARLSAEGEVQK